MNISFETTSFKLTEKSLIFSLLLLNFFIIPGHLPGISVVSIEYIKQLVLITSAILILIWVSPEMAKKKYLNIVLYLFIGLVTYFTISLFWSVSLFNSFRYINKVWLTLALILMFLSISQENKRQFVFLFGKFLWAYILLSFFSEFFLRDLIHPNLMNDSRFAGFSGIHSTKYIFSIGTIYFLMFGFFYKKKSDILGFILCLLIALLSLQRALIGALFLSVIIIYALHLIKIKKVKILLQTIVFAVTTTILSFFLVFEFPPLKERMFYSDNHALVAKKLILSGDIIEVYSLVQKSGREDFWSAAQLNENPLIGNGFGTAGYFVEMKIGEYWEMHNDYLKLYVETGYIGVIFYLCFIVGYFIFVSFRIFNCKSLFSLCLYYMALGVFLITPLNGLFDNGLDHIAKNICFSLLIFITSYSAEQKSATKYKIIST
ncbi:MAG: O-antigen ligase family protein [Balneolaceae bacterium]